MAVITGIENLEDLPTYILIMIGLNGIYSFLEKNKIDEIAAINNRRKVWIKQVALRLSQNQSTLENYANQILDLDLKDSLSRNELGLTQDIVGRDYVPPDIQLAEEEMVKLEERASFLIAGTIFLPVFFAIIHIFRYVPVSVLLLELAIFLLLSLLLLQTQNPVYDLDGWEEIYSKLEDEKVTIIAGGRTSLHLFPMFFASTYQELGNDSHLLKQSPSALSLFLTLQVMNSLPTQHRSDLLTTYLHELRELPKYEKLHVIRWKAYQTRILLISTVGMALSGMLASIGNFNINNYSEGLIPIRSTPHIWLPLYCLGICITTLYLQRWMAFKKMIPWIFIWTIIYFSTNILTNSIFN
ncbi:MAG: hypothetical protein INQ03_01365 [Candidatus Heimdallarchaeota archaeon]|nr:hypothetical protein [Candidatus Heimdallarchaeota archaeon]